MEIIEVHVTSNLNTKVTQKLLYLKETEKVVCYFDRFFLFLVVLFDLVDYEKRFRLMTNLTWFVLFIKGNPICIIKCKLFLWKELPSDK